MTLLILAAFLLITGIGYWLRYLNLTHLKTHGRTVPPEFEGTIDPATLARISDYTVEHSRFGQIESVIDNCIVLLFFFGGLLGIYDTWISSFTGSFLGNGILFALV